MDRKIRVLLTIPNFDTAGSGKVLYDLAKGLDKQRFSVEIACESTAGEFFKIVETLGSPIHVFKTKTPYRPYVTLIPRILKISKFYRKQQYDIIHSWQWSSDWTEALAAKLVGIKWIYTKKAMGFRSKHWKIKSYLADFIVTINDEMREYFSYKTNQRLIPLGIDTNYYSPQHFERHFSDQFKIVTVANLVPVKGIEILIQAFSTINEGNLELLIVGDYQNPYGNKLENLCEELKVQNQVKFLGRLSDVRSILADADLYVIPTLDQGRREGFPMALVEAMAMAIPVVGSNISGIRYVLKDFPNLLFNAGNANELADKIVEIKSISQADRSLLGEQLREYAKQLYSMLDFIQNHEALYSKILDLKSSNLNV